MTVHSSGEPAALAFVVIPMLLALCLSAGAAVAWLRSGARPSQARHIALRTLALTSVWMSATWMAAASGLLAEWKRTPPPFAVLIVLIIVIAVAIAFSPFGTRLARYLPLWALVGVQGFRLPLELAMHRMYERGIMPIEMSFSGRNFDIVTGATAFVVAALVLSGRGGPRLVLRWNLLGLALLTNVVIVAILGTPRIQYFGPQSVNVWVTFPPYVWLPAIMVPAALAGHLIIFRALSFGPAPSRPPIQRSASRDSRRTDSTTPASGRRLEL
jgi:hypothetical protein